MSIEREESYSALLTKSPEELKDSKINEVKRKKIKHRLKRKSSKSDFEGESECSPEETKSKSKSYSKKSPKNLKEQKLLK